MEGEKRGNSTIERRTKEGGIAQGWIDRKIMERKIAYRLYRKGYTRTKDGKIAWGRCCIEKDGCKDNGGKKGSDGGNAAWARRMEGWMEKWIDGDKQMDNGRKNSYLYYKWKTIGT